jgi:hypothetical protein
VGEDKGNFQFPLPSWRKKFLVKTKRFAAFARLKNKKSAGEGKTRQRQDTTKTQHGKDKQQRQQHI